MTSEKVRSKTQVRSGLASRQSVTSAASSENSEDSYFAKQRQKVKGLSKIYDTPQKQSKKLLSKSPSPPATGKKRSDKVDSLALNPIRLPAIQEFNAPVGIEGPSKAFMERQNKAMKPPAMITDWTKYRKKNNLKKTDKIFICKGYYHLKKALKERGWHENLEYESPIFHMKVTVKSKDIFKMQKGTLHNLNSGDEFTLKDF
mmetsp:Transcript_10364/g.15944  ORF Transcript_10364/g.15944 Transcript_10364/m.15944 type:complete len:202 (+) Transcript_10364:687-1292(+)